jgi:hypothetical protein
VRFSKFDQTAFGASTTSSKESDKSVSSWGIATGAWRLSHTPSSDVVKEIVELFFYSPLGLDDTF